MLKLQKIKKKKLAIYIVIIAIMFAGTGFFIYKNYFLTSKNSSTGFNVFDADNFKQLNIIQEAGKEPSPAVGKEDKILNFDFFNDPKFQSLKDNSVVPTPKVRAGNKNPFKPY